jgi:sarcosine oxidase subunit gamma
MSESLVRRHGLEPFLHEVGGSPANEAGVRVTIRGDLGHINLRGCTSDAAFVQTVRQQLGQALPLQPNTVAAERHRVCWLGPDEWLIVTEAAGAEALVGGLERALSGKHASVNDVSGGYVTLMLNGAACRELLAKGCTLDLHPRAFAVGDCAQSGLARANVLVALVDDAPTFMIVVRRSFADYLGRWLIHAGRDTGVTFIEA